MEDGELASLLEYHTHSLPNMHCLTNQLDPPAITHHYRGPPSFRERGLLRASPTAFYHEQFATRLHFPKPPSMWKEGDRLRWRIENSLAHESELHGCVRATLRCRAN